jgi:hypothetical protein
MEGKPRPTSVTVIAVLLLLCASLLMVIAGGTIVAGSPQVRKMLADHGITLANNPQAQEMLTNRAWSLLAGSGVILVLAIAVLKRQNWGRLLFLCVVPVWIALTWVQYGFQTAKGIEVLCVG